LYASEKTQKRLIKNQANSEAKAFSRFALIASENACAPVEKFFIFSLSQNKAARCSIV
jgi:hypothetical protein